MDYLFSIIGLILSFVAAFTLIRNIIIDRAFVIKKVKVIGFDAYTYLTHTLQYNTIYNANIYPVVEIEENNKKIKVAVSMLSNRYKVQEGDEIEVIYPKGKVNKMKLHTKEDIYKFYWLTLILGIIITILSN